MALNWLLQRQSLVIPIIGARRATQIQDNLKCLDWQLTSEQIANLDEATKIELGFPHIFWRTTSPGRSFSVEPKPASIRFVGSRKPSRHHHRERAAVCA